MARVDTADNLQASYLMPYYYPSHRTDGPVGIAVKASAFSWTCNTGYPYYQDYECDRNYLYLVWKDRFSNDIYTSVFQNANPYRFTRSQPSFYQARTGTGASWIRNAAPLDNIQGLYTDPSNSKPYQFNGYGRY